ncbi:hypothetical protein D9M71_126150 [compost metagenome]
MFHLHAGVHLHEVHLAIGEQELHGTGVLVAHGLGRAHGEVTDVGALLGSELRARGDLDEFLVAALDRAVALEQVHSVAEGVGEDLRFDVLRVDDALLEEDFRRAERLGGFGNHARVGLFQLGARVAATDATTATTGGGLEHHRVADAVTFAQGLFEVGDVAFGAGGDRYAGLDHAAARFGLVAHAADHFGRGTDELDPALGADIRQLGVFGEETVARVQGVAAGLDRQIHQFARVQVSRQGVITDAVSLIGALDVQGVPVGIGVDGHRADAHFGASAHDADGDLTTVGDQDFLDHEFSLDQVNRRTALPVVE